MANIVIFGTQDFAQLAKYYLDFDSEHSVVAFCVHEQYLPSDLHFDGLPVVAFEKVQDVYPPDDFMFFAPMAPTRMNKLRKSIYEEIKIKGYKLISYISSKATLFNNRMGDNCFILENNTLQPFADIGNNVVLWSGNHIGHHGFIKDHVTLTSHVVMSGHCTIESFSFIGVNATLRDGITIAEGSLIGMGSMVTRSTEPWGVYVGSPARKGKKRSDEVGM